MTILLIEDDPLLIDIYSTKLKESGFEVTIAEDGEKGLKVVLLSNLGQKEEIEKGLSLGADRYLIKAHFTPTQVVQEIQKLLTTSA